MCRTSHSCPLIWTLGDDDEAARAPLAFCPTPMLWTQVPRSGRGLYEMKRSTLTAFVLHTKKNASSNPPMPVHVQTEESKSLSTSYFPLSNGYAHELSRYRPERVPSPSESLVSVTSHLPSQNAHHTNGASSTRGASAHQNHTSTLASSGANRNANGSSATNKRRGGANSSNNRVSTPLPNDYPSHNPASSIPSHRAAGSGLPSSSSNHHPSSSSNLATYTNGAGVMTNGNAAHYYNNDHPHSLSGTPDLNLSSTQLLGPGVPFARSASVHSTATNANGATGGRNGSASVNTMNSVSADGGANEAGDVDGDNDDGRTYCYCDGVSYGEMIACDDENCEREWVSDQFITLSCFDQVADHHHAVPLVVYWVDCMP